MYTIRRQETEKLVELMEQGYGHTIFLTYPWVKFLEKNQNAESVVLELSIENKVVAYFVGLIVKKIGVRILGSPFEGWLTCDMGFIRIKEIEINEALRDVAKFAFRNLKCWFVQIIDKNIKVEELDNSIHFNSVQDLYLNNENATQEILQNFTSHGRRDIRASFRKNTVVEIVPFNNEFVDIYYDQLVDVFEKQGLKPFYSREKLYDLVKAFQGYQSNVVAIICKNDMSEPIGSVFSFGYGNWAYYMGAASYRKNQKLLPNEACFWQFINIWNERKVCNIDLVGYRDYKKKYNPILVQIPVIYFERLYGLLLMKNMAKKVVMLTRKFKGKFI